MTYLREAVLELADELEGDNLVPISEAIYNAVIAERLRNIVDKTDELDDN